MGTSAFRPVSISDTRTVKNTITQSGHGFVAGNVIRFDVATQLYVKAIATSAFEAEVVGVVESVDGASFVLIYGGEIDLSAFDSTLTYDDVYFLSSSTAGSLTNVSPTIGGYVIKPIVVRRSNRIGIVTNFIGTVIGGDSTVDLSEIQPVGSVQAYCGLTSGIPSQWSLCDGNKLAVADYPVYAEKVGIAYGYRVSTIISIVTTNPNLSINQDLSALMVGKILSQNNIMGWVEAISQTAANTYAATIVEYPFFTVDRDEAIITRVDDGGASIAGTSTTFTVSLTSSSLTHVGKPDMQSRTVVGSLISTAPRNFTGYTLGMLGGKESHTLSLEELPTHTHAFNGTPSTITSSQGGTHSHQIASATTSLRSGDGTFVLQGIAGNAAIGANTDYTSAPAAGLIGANPLVEDAGTHTHSFQSTPAGSISLSGEGNAHENRQPFISLHWIVRVKPDGRASILELASLATLTVGDLADADTSGVTTGDILVYNGTNFVPFHLASGYSGPAQSFLSIDIASDKVSFGSPVGTTYAGFVSIGATGNHLSLIDEDASGPSFGGIVLGSDNGIFTISGCSLSGATVFNPTLNVQPITQSVGINNGTTFHGVLDVRLTGATAALNVGTGGQVAVGATVNPSLTHQLIVAGPSVLVGVTAGSITGSTLGVVYLGQHGTTGDLGVGLVGILEGLSGGSNRTRLEVRTNNGANAPTTKFVVGPNGNVGIGLTGPTQLLQISGVSGTYVSVIAGTSHVRFGGQDALIGTTGSVPFSIQTNSTNRINVGATGNVGIGITAGAAKLHVDDTTTARIRETAGGLTLDFYVSGASGSNIVSDGADLKMTVGGSIRQVITTTGNVGIGTSSPTAKLEVAGVAKAQNTPKVWARWNEDGTGVTGSGIVSVAKTGTGDYLITHNLNTTSYAAFPAVTAATPVGSTGGLLAQIGSQSGNTLTVQIRNLSGNTAATDLTYAQVMILGF